MIAVHAHLLSQLAVDLQHPLLTVERDEETRLRQGVDDLQLLLAGVAGDVKHIRPVINHGSTLAEQLVDDTAHRDLVAGNGGGGEDHLVTGADLHLLVGGEGHAVQGAHFLALRAGGDDDLLVLGQALELVDVHQCVFGDLHIAQLRGDLHHVLHAAAGNGHLPAALGGGIQHLLDTVDVGGEGGDDDTLVAILELAHEGGTHHLFGGGETGTLHVGGVGAQTQDPLLAQLTQAGQVDDLPVNGGGVDLEVAGVDDGAHLSVDGESHGVGDGMVHMDELHGELACPDALARLYGDELGGFHQLVLLQLQLDETGGEAGAVDGHVDLFEHIGDGADVVLVAVGDEQAPDPGFVLDEIRHIGDHAVDAVHVITGEGHTTVHHDDLAAVFIGGHVLADLVETAKGNDFQFFCHRYRNSFAERPQKGGNM